MAERRILGIVAARGGSKGLPRKNIRPLCGHPLIHYAVTTLLAVPDIARVVVSTDDEEIARAAEASGAEVPFRRPDDLAEDKITLVNVFKHALDTLDAAGDRYDAILSVPPTAPLVRSQSIARMIETFHRTGCESVAAVAEVRHAHPYLCQTLTGPDADIAQPLIELPEGSIRYPRQARPTAYYFTGAAFLRDRKLFYPIDPTTNALGSSPRVVVIDDEEAVNIDDLMDFRMAELVMHERNARCSL